MTRASFLRFMAAKEAAARHIFPIGELTGIARYTALHRYEPFWMKAVSGTAGGNVVPMETQFLLAETESGDCLLLVPLIDGVFRACFAGNGRRTALNLWRKQAILPLWERNLLDCTPRRGRIPYDSN